MAGTVLTGILNIVWGNFDASHQPIQALGINLPGQQILAYVAGVWLISTGLAILWRRSERVGVAASAFAYLAFAAFWLARYHVEIHALGWKSNAILSVTFGIAQQIMLVAPAAIIYVSTSSADSLLQKRAAMAAGLMLGLPPVIFGLFHLIGVRVFATIVPRWMPFGYFWAVLTGIAFILAGCAICSGIMNVMAARLLALMLLLFDGLVEIPPIFTRLHDQQTWGAAVYNVTAIGACWIFAQFLASRAERRQVSSADNVTMSRPNSVVA